MSIFLSPFDSSVLSPLEVIGILDSMLFGLSMDEIEDLDLMHMDCYECLNFHSLKLVKVIQAHLTELSHHSMDFFLFLLKLNNLFFLSSLKAISDLLGPNLLNTKKSNLRWERFDKLSKRHREAVLGTSSTDHSHRPLHLQLEFEEPFFNITFSLDSFSEKNFLFA